MMRGRARQAMGRFYARQVWLAVHLGAFADTWAAWAARRAGKLSGWRDER